MIAELNLEFSHPNKVIIHFQAQSSGELDFVSPLSEEVQKDIRWYLETYATLYPTQDDENRAQHITDKLPEWGTALFEAVFHTPAAQRLYDAFQKEGGGLLTISTTQPTILSLPWELLHTPAQIPWFQEESNISIRRHLLKKNTAHQPLVIKPKNWLRILFIVSRPHDVEFIEPRADVKAVLDALDEMGLDSFEVEFLRPATFENLVNRLERKEQYTDYPPVDILHFDGYGVEETLSIESPKSATKSVADFFRKKSHRKRAMSYLLLENQDVQKHLVDADTLGNLFKQNQIAFILLSACQSATANHNESMDSVAMQLIHAGIPAVLVKRHTAFRNTSRQLFADFYDNLSNGDKLGEAFDKARRNLYRQLAGEEAQQYNHGLFTVKFHDWFLPALYQTGEDMPLLSLDSELSDYSEDDTTSNWSNSTPSLVHNIPRSPSIADLLLLFLKDDEIVSSPLEKTKRLADEKPQPINLPKIQPVGFWGRSQELWFIEQAFIQGTRCITIFGGDGQGKTELTMEAGRWLYRTNLFEQVCFISYAGFRSVDPVGFAIQTMEKVFQQNLADVETITQMLEKQPTLLILDNLESLEEMIPQASSSVAEQQEEQSVGEEKPENTDESSFPKPANFGKGEILQQFLEVVKEWSKVGETRILITIRQPNLSYYEFFTENNLEYQSLSLSGLTEQDAVLYFQQCLKLQLPFSRHQQLPTLSLLLEWFEQVHFLPLSINLLARQLKKRYPGEVDLRLKFAQMNWPDQPLLTCLNLFWDNLNNKTQAWLPKLGVFQGGVIEQVVLRELDELPEEQWQKLLESLNTTGLLKIEAVPGITVPYFRFHPILASSLQSHLFTGLSAETQAHLLARHRLHYYQLCNYLFMEEKEKPEPIRAITKWELPNLLYAVNNSLDAGETWAPDFVHKISKFLRIFGMKHDRMALNQRIAQEEDESVGSLTWYLARCRQGQQLYNRSRYQEAEQVFHEVLTELGEPVCDEHCFLLNQLGRCFIEQGQIAPAIRFYLDGLTLATQLKISKKMKRQVGILQADLARALTELGDYENAKELYDSVISIMEALDDQRSVGVLKGFLGNIASLQGEQHEAAKHHCEALIIFQELEEPALEAKGWHGLGQMYEDAKRWDAAELAYRKAAWLEESQGNLGDVTTIWNQLAIVTEAGGKLEEAEAWYRKAIEGGKLSQDWLISSHALNNLANLLKTQSHKLPEAQQLAEEAVAIKQNLEPTVAKIWATYYVLAEIAEKQNDLATANKYRRLSHQKRAEFGGTRYELRRFKELIITSVFATKVERVKEYLMDFLEEMAEHSGKFAQIAATIHRVLDGERNEEVLCERLSYDDAWVISAILNGIENPETLEKLFTHFEK